MRTPPKITNENGKGFDQRCSYQYREIIWVDLTDYSQKTIDKIIDDEDIRINVKSGYAIVLCHITRGNESWYEIGLLDDGRFIVSADRMFKVGDEFEWNRSEKGA